MNAHAQISTTYGGHKPVILTVDDDVNNLSVVRDCLVECNYTILVAEDGESAIQRADYARPDLILLDVMMPGIDGYETCRRLKLLEGTKDIPVIFMTALAETGHKVKGLTVGAVDYITKPFQREELLARIGVHLHNRELTRKLQEANNNLERRVEERTTDLSIANRQLEDEIAERQATQESLQEQAARLEEEIEDREIVQEALRQSELKFRAIFNQTFQMIGLLTPEGVLLEVNKTALDFCGINESAVLGRHFWETPWWSHSKALQDKIRNAVKEAASGNFVRFETEHQGLNGKHSAIDFSLKPILDKDGNVLILIPEGRDITTSKKLERELRQSQKMEAIGTLAGGIAHDFNNILTAIIGYTGLAKCKLTNDAAQRDLERVLVASERARDLVNGILVFSRQSELERKPVQVGPVIEEVLKLLRSTLPTTVEIHQQNTTLPDGCTVLADETQLHQVLMNMGTNAAHAMRTKGGILNVSVSDITADAALIALHSDLTPGAYVLLEVSDTGHGMHRAVKERIFDPYFTTKKIGEGTGMGLAVVQGIVKSHGGAISAYSVPGKGTTFKIYFPKIADEITHINKADVPLRGGAERILFVDDETVLVELGQELLESLGYFVTATSSSVEALNLFRSDPYAFDLVITDMTMPGLSGKELALELIDVRPDFPIILCTGFSESINKKQARETGISDFVLKPYSVTDLDISIRRALVGVVPMTGVDVLT